MGFEVNKWGRGRDGARWFSFSHGLSTVRSTNSQHINRGAHKLRRRRQPCVRKEEVSAQVPREGRTDIVGADESWI